MVNLVGQRLRNYQLIRLLGSGNFADVYLGEHIYIEVHASIKVLRLRRAEALLRQ
jgi:serine/threonine protein kinase